MGKNSKGKYSSSKAKAKTTDGIQSIITNSTAGVFNTPPPPQSTAASIKPDHETSKLFQSLSIQIDSVLKKLQQNYQDPSLPFLTIDDLSDLDSAVLSLITYQNLSDPIPPELGGQQADPWASDESSMPKYLLDVLSIDYSSLPVKVDTDVNGMCGLYYKDSSVAATVDDVDGGLLFNIPVTCMLSLKTELNRILTPSLRKSSAPFTDYENAVMLLNTTNPNILPTLHPR